MSQPQTTRLFRYVALGFGLGALGLLGVVTSVTLGRTTITLTLAPEKIETTFALTVAPNPAEGELSGRYLTGALTDRASVTGTTEAATPAKAHGAVRILNTTNAVQPLAATTRLLASNGVLFRTLRRVDVPAGGEVAVDVEADQPGSAGEIGPSRFTLPGLRSANQQLVYGVSDAAMTGGTTSGTTITDADRDAARTNLTAELTAQLLADFERQLNAEGRSFSVHLLGQTATPGPASGAAVSVTVALEAVALESTALAQRAEAALRETLASGTTLEGLRGEPSLSMSDADERTGRVTLAVTATGLATPAAGNPLLQPDRFAGLTVAEVKATAATIPGVTRAEIASSLPWLSRTPGSASRIRLVLQLDSLTEGGSTSTVEANANR